MPYSHTTGSCKGTLTRNRIQDPTRFLVSVLTWAFVSTVTYRCTPPGHAGAAGRIPVGDWTYCSIACKVSAHLSRPHWPTRHLSHPHWLTRHLSRPH